MALLLGYGDNKWNPFQQLHCNNNVTAPVTPPPQQQTAVVPWLPQKAGGIIPWLGKAAGDVSKILHYTDFMKSLFGMLGTRIPV